MFSTVNDMKIVYPIGLPENKNSNKPSKKFQS